jgi:hypothetical protein
MTGENRRGTMIPVIAALAVALAGTAAMFLIEFSPGNDVEHNGISMITAASADKAGATAHPTADNVDPAKAAAR